MSAYRLVNVRTFKRSTGRSCMHCGRPATVTAVRIRTQGKNRMEVRYCADHYELAAAVTEKTRDA